MYNQFENQCIEIKDQYIGCSNNLNRNSCINQLSFGENLEQKCIFQNRCIEVNAQHLKNLGCNDNYSKYACLSVIQRDCFWNEICQDSSKLSLSSEFKDEIYPYPVTPSLCAKYQKYPSMNKGFKGDYKCVTIYDIQFKELKCSTLGLNELGCKSILTVSELCLFDNYKCKNINPSEITDCSQKLNKLACLSISKPNLLCQWQKEKCQIYIFNDNLQCKDIFNVNINACAKQDGLCKFDVHNFKCIVEAKKKFFFISGRKLKIIFQLFFDFSASFFN